MRPSTCRCRHEHHRHRAAVERAGFFGAAAPAAVRLAGHRRRGRRWPASASCSASRWATKPLSAHRTLRAAALAAARPRRGHAALRLRRHRRLRRRRPGTRARRRLAGLASTTAIDALRRPAPLRRLCLWGLRAGALLAAAVAQRRGDVDLLIAHRAGGRRRPLPARATCAGRRRQHAGAGRGRARNSPASCYTADTTPRCRHWIW